MQPSKIEPKCLCRFVAVPGMGAGKHSISKDSGVQATKSENVIIDAKSACQGWIRNAPHTILGSELNCALGLV